MFLLDVNVLIALADPFHVHHKTVSSWFSGHQREGWATCPLTENGVLRIVGHPNYPKGPGSPEAARTLLERLLAQPGHQFWADTLSLANSRTYPSLPASKHLNEAVDKVRRRELLFLSLLSHSRDRRGLEIRPVRRH